MDRNVYTQAKITDSYSSADSNNVSHTEAAISDSAAVVISGTAVRTAETEVPSDNGEESVLEKDDSTLLPVILGTVAAVAAAAVIGIYYFTKK